MRHARRLYENTRIAQTCIQIRGRGWIPQLEKIIEVKIIDLERSSTVQADFDTALKKLSSPCRLMLLLVQAQPHHRRVCGGRGK